MIKYIKIVFLLLPAFLVAQKVSISIDSTKKKIGAEFKLTLKTQATKKDKVVFPKDPFFGQMEVINSYKTDTVEKDNLLHLTKVYGITQFDTGKFLVPKLKVKFNKKDIFTDSLLVEVANVKVDTTKQKLYDIKDIIATEEKTNWWQLLAIVLGIAALGALAYYLIKKYKNKETKSEEIDTRSPLEKANANLQQLDNKHYIQKGDFKNYYSDLTDIARRYIEEELKIPAMESTTSELVHSLENIIQSKKIKVSREVLTNLNQILQKADLIKFAKSIPNQDEISQDKTVVQETILNIHSGIPQETDLEFDTVERQRRLIEQELAKKQKQKKQLYIVSGVIALVLLLVGLFAFEGFEYLKDKFIGHPTKELIASEWIKSNYGNPGIELETPKVLKRTQVKVNSKDNVVKGKDLQTFNYGSLIDNFYILVSTFNTNEPTPINLEIVGEQTIKAYEKEGVKNILLKIADYDLQNGIKGKRVFGTMSVPVPASTEYQKVYYELILFNQYRGLQQVMITCRDDDPYGKQIIERIKKSIELQEAER